MKFHEGMDVIFNAGDLEIPGKVVPGSPWNDALKGCVLVDFGSSRQWMEPNWLRIMVLQDERRVFGSRFCDWQRILWYTLLCYFGKTIRDLSLSYEELRDLWLNGHSVRQVVLQAEKDHGWTRYGRIATPTIDAYAVSIEDEEENFGLL